MAMMRAYPPFSATGQTQTAKGTDLRHIAHLAAQLRRPVMPLTVGRAFTLTGSLPSMEYFRV
jgi:hypothetical protein